MTDQNLEILNKFYAGVAQLVERQPSKLNVAGSNPVSRSETLSSRLLWERRLRLVPQSRTDPACRRSSGVERFLGKEEVTGSNPVVGSTNLSAPRVHPDNYRGRRRL